MLEYYSAYADFNDQMAFIEKLFQSISKQVLGSTKVDDGEVSYDFGKPFQRISLKESVAQKLSVETEAMDNRDFLTEVAKKYKIEDIDNLSNGKILFELFEDLVETDLINPTFITDYPKSMSPLTKEHRSNPKLTERFELIINGMEIANAYSELNDPIDQLKRFENQLELSKKGDDEAMFIDMDFIKSLEYGMPPTSGIGIGIDRLIMLMTNKTSIQEVLFFPQMKPIKEAPQISDDAKLILDKLIKEGECGLDNFKSEFDFSNKKIPCKYVSDMYYEYVLPYVLSYTHMYYEYNVMNENIFTFIYSSAYTKYIHMHCKYNMNT